MEIHLIIGYVLAIFVGISLGLIGSGGSILSVPILVYIMRVEPLIATAYSLFIVGSTAFVGSIKKVKEQLVDFKKVFLFGIPTVVTVFFTRIYILPSVPKTIYILSNFSISKATLIMVIFALVMMLASVSMIKRSPENVVLENDKLNYPILIFQGIIIGFISGFVGVGGGFLIVPTLLFFAKTPLKIAIGSSFFIISAQSLIGFLGDLQTKQIMDWKLLTVFTALSIVGFFIGNAISKKVSAEKLKVAFGYFVLATGIFILTKELLLS